MAIFLTGVTGYIGSYVAHGLLTEHDDRIAVLVRAKNPDEAKRRLWKSLQLHMTFDEFAQHLPRFDVYLGDLHSPDLGLDAANRKTLVESMDSVLHIAASLNRKSAKACFNTNLRGTLTILKMARDAQDHHGLRRFSDVSTTAVSGLRTGDTVSHEDMVQWDRSDFDPYARTKKFCEHMVHELLPDVKTTVFRPSTVLGDSRRPETTQFDMVRAFAALAYMRVLPLNPEWRYDICPANYVARGIVHVHQSENPKYDSYNLSSGTSSLTYRQIVGGLKDAGHKPMVRFAPALGSSFKNIVELGMRTPRKYGLVPAASLMKVFWPYLVQDTVFDNSHIVEALGEAPTPFTEYALPLLRWAVKNKFSYPYAEWPADGDERLAKLAVKVA